MRPYISVFKETFKFEKDGNIINLVYDPLEEVVTIDTNFIKPLGNKLPFGRTSRTIDGYHVPIIELFGFSSNLEDETINNIRNLLKGKKVEGYDLDKHSYQLFTGYLIYSLLSFFQWFPVNIDIVTNVESSGTLSINFLNNIKSSLYNKEHVSFINNGIIKNYKNSVIDKDIFNKIPSMNQKRYDTMLSTLQNKGLHKSIRPIDRKFIKNHVKVSTELFDSMYDLIYNKNKKQIGLVIVDDYRTDGTTLREAVSDVLSVFKQDINENRIQLDIIGLFMFSNSINQHNSIKVKLGKTVNNPFNKRNLDFSTYK